MMALSFRVSHSDYAGVDVGIVLSSRLVTGVEMMADLKITYLGLYQILMVTIYASVNSSMTGDLEKF